MLGRGNSVTILGIAILSIILLTGSLNFQDASAATFNKDVTLVLTPSDLLNQWEVVGAADALTAISVNDGETSYVVSSVNDALQSFSAPAGQFQDAVTINSIDIFSVGMNFDTSKKPTKYSIGVAKGTDAIAKPNGGERVPQTWEDPARNIQFLKDPFSAKNANQQTPWTVDQLNNMEFSDGDPLEFVIEQNTDAKQIGVTHFYVVVNAAFIVYELGSA